MKNQSNLLKEADNINIQSTKKKREWKDPELFEEDYRSIEQFPGMPDAPDQGNS